MKKGLVLEGGAMRGMFTCGVIDVFMENDIDFDGCIGVSAGAAFGCNIKSKQIGRPIRYNKRFCNDERYASFSEWLKTGDLYNEDFCYDEMIHVYDIWDEETFKNNPMEFYCVATDIEEGIPVYYKCKNGDDKDIRWIRASASMPFFSNPVEIDGHKYLDGGTTDSIPLRFMEANGYDKIIVVETQPYHFIKTKQKYLPVIKHKLNDYPLLIHALENRHIMYNRQKEYVKTRESEKKVYVIRPENSLNIKSTCKDPNELERVYQIGRQTALAHLSEIKEYLNTK